MSYKVIVKKNATDLYPTYIVNSFTDVPFKGNPAGVFLTNQNELTSAQMLQIAQELGYSETAFIKSIPTDENKGTSFSIRFFSPKMEIPLCGHATLAAAKVVYEFIELNHKNELHFFNIQMIDLAVTLDDGLIKMSFPAYETQPAEVPQAMLDSLGIEEVHNVAYNKETNILLLEIESTSVLSELSPNFATLKQSHDSINGVLVTAPSKDGEYDFHSRYFWPWSGTDEDPVTGGTHTFLAPYWADRLGKKKMKSFQSSARTGWMELEVTDDKKVIIKGQAVVLFSGNMHLGDILLSPKPTSTHRVL